MDSRRGLELWGPVGRWAFLNWPRGSWQYDLICGAIIVGLFVLPGPESHQALDVDGVLAAIEAADAEMNGFTADMVTTERIVLFDEEQVEGGTVAFLKPAFFRRDIVDPSASTMVVGEGEVTLYIPRIKQAQVFSLEGALREGEELVIPGLASSAELNNAYDVTLLGVSGEAGANVYELRLVPAPDTEAAKRWRTITLQVVEGEWHPARHIVLEEYSGDTTTFDLANVSRNPDIGPDDFKLDLPDDVAIVRQQIVAGPGIS